MREKGQTSLHLHRISLLPGASSWHNCNPGPVLNCLHFRAGASTLFSVKVRTGTSEAL